MLRRSSSARPPVGEHSRRVTSNRTSRRVTATLTVMVLFTVGACTSSTSPGQAGTQPTLAPADTASRATLTQSSSAGSASASASSATESSSPPPESASTSTAESSAESTSTRSDSIESASSDSTSPSTHADQPSSSAAPPDCPNPEGMLCLGALTAGKSYTTQVMSPTITYSVPVNGWFNYEDTSGNFLLVPPGSDLPGVNAGTSDFIGVYTSIGASRFTDPPECPDVEFVPAVPTTPAAMAAWMAAQVQLKVTKPRAASVGGLDGLMLDVRLADPEPEVCSAPDLASVFLLFSGYSPSSLDHGVIPAMTMRLILLKNGDDLTVIEIDDIDAAPATLASMTTVAKDFVFTL